MSLGRVPPLGRWCWTYGSLKQRMEKPSEKLTAGATFSEWLASLDCNGADCSIVVEPRSGTKMRGAEKPDGAVVFVGRARLCGLAMLQITPQMRVLVAHEPVDGRKGIGSLVQRCREKLNDDPFSGCVFAFRSRSGTGMDPVFRILELDSIHGGTSQSEITIYSRIQRSGPSQILQAKNPSLWPILNTVENFRRTTKLLGRSSLSPQKRRKPVVTGFLSGRSARI